MQVLKRLFYPSILMIALGLTPFARGMAAENTDVNTGPNTGPVGATSAWLSELETWQTSIAGMKRSPAQVIVSMKGGTTPDDLLRYVRTQTRMVPYQGVLRGSLGVLLDGTGNSLDRALLLAELMRLAGHEPRLAYAEISPDQAAILLQTARANDGANRTAPDLKAYRALDRAWRDQAAAAKGIPTVFLTPPLTGETILARMAAAGKAQVQVSAQADYLGNIVSRNIDAADIQSQALRNHWWVQVNLNGTWVDFDPSEQAKPMSTNYRVASRVIEPDLSKPVEASLPPELFHRLTIRLVIEKTADGVRQEFVPLDESYIPALSPLLPLQLSIFPPRERLAELASGDLLSAMQTVGEWQPILQIGGEIRKGQRFDDKGNLLDGAAAPASGGGLLGGAFGQINKALEFRPDGDLTAAWVEYEIQAPGKATKTIRRQLFDFAAFAASSGTGASGQSPSRANLSGWRISALSDALQILPMVTRMDPVTVQRARIDSLLANRAFFLSLAKAAQSGNALTSEFVKPALASAPYLWAQARAEISPVAREVYIDGINIVTTHSLLVPGTVGGVALFRAMDIVTNTVAPRPGATAAAFDLRLAQGVADTLAETLVLPGDSGRNNAAALMLALGNEGADLQLVDPENPAANVDLSQDILALFGNAKKAGNIAISPARAVRLNGENSFGWWQINPVSGKTLGRNHLGWGATSTEYAIVTSMILFCPVVDMTVYLVDEISSFSFLYGSSCAIGEQGEAVNSPDDTAKQPADASNNPPAADKKPDAENQKKSAKKDSPKSGKTDQSRFWNNPAPQNSRDAAGEPSFGDTPVTETLPSADNLAAEESPSVSGAGGLILNGFGRALGGAKEPDKEVKKAEKSVDQKALKVLGSIGGINSDGEILDESDNSSDTGKKSRTPQLELEISYGF